MENNNLYILGTTSIVLVCIISFFLVPQKNDKFYNIVHKEKMYSIKNSNEINGTVNGNFVLGIGSVNGNIKTENYYYFFLEQSNPIGYKGFIKHKVPASKTLLVEKDTIPTYIENKVLQIQTKTYLFDLFEKPQIEEKKYSYSSIEAKFKGIKIPEAEKYEYILIIPKGTVTEKQVWDVL